MVGTRVCLRTLSLAEISDLLHASSDTRPPVHHRPHPWKEGHLGPHQPTRPGHDHHLCFITADALYDRFGDGLSRGQEGFAHGRHLEVHLLKRPHRRASPPILPRMSTELLTPALR